MRRKEWATKELFYQYLNNDLKRIFGEVELSKAKDYVKRYVELSEILFQDKSSKETLGKLEYWDLRKFYTAQSSIQELSIELLQKFNDGEKIFLEILTITQFNANFQLALSIASEDEIKVSEFVFDAAKSILRDYANKPQFYYRKELNLLLDELDGKFKRVDKETRQRLRLFGFYLFNGTVDWKILQTELEVDYLEFLKVNPIVFGQACCVFLNHLKRDSGRSQERCAKWIRKSIEPSYDVTFDEWEIDFQITGDHYISYIKKMVIEISEEKFAPDLLSGNYFPELVDCAAGFLEMTFAIWSNVVQIDSKDDVTNLEITENRVAQWIMAHLDEDYEIKPELEDWETELL